MVLRCWSKVSDGPLDHIELCSSLIVVLTLIGDSEKNTRHEYREIRGSVGAYEVDQVLSFYKLVDGVFQRRVSF